MRLVSDGACLKYRESSHWRCRDEQAHTRVDPPCDFRAHFNEDAGQERDWWQGQDRSGIKKKATLFFPYSCKQNRIFFFFTLSQVFLLGPFFPETTRYFHCGLLAWSLGFRKTAKQLLLGEVDCRNRRISGKLGPQNPGQPETAGMWRGNAALKKTCSHMSSPGRGTRNRHEKETRGQP